MSSFWGIVSYTRNIILLGSTTKKKLLTLSLVFLDLAALGFRGLAA